MCETCSKLKRMVRKKSHLLLPSSYFTLIFVKIGEATQEYDHELIPESRTEVDNKKKGLVNQLNEHLSRARQSRALYAMRRHKACEERSVKNGDISIEIDGAGSQASNYIPRFNTTEKGEPKRYDMLKIKSTYIKVGDLCSIYVRFILTLRIDLDSWNW